jgi:hypothetical protein
LIVTTLVLYTSLIVTTLVLARLLIVTTLVLARLFIATTLVLARPHHQLLSNPPHQLLSNHLWTLILGLQGLRVVLFNRSYSIDAEKFAGEPVAATLLQLQGRDFFAGAQGPANPKAAE